MSSSTAAAAAEETVLVVGSTGHIGVSAVIGALRSGRKVLAIVRNQTSAEKLFRAVGSRDNITTVEASIVAEDGTQSVVDRVRAGEFPAFHHVYIAAGGSYPTTSLTDATLTQVRNEFHLNFEASWLAYKATIPYLLAQNHRTSTFTVCTGAQGDMGLRGLPSITQGALISLINTAGVELHGTNVRLVELYLATRVEIDAEAEVHGTMRSSDFAKSYTLVLERADDVRDARVYVQNVQDVETLRWRPRGEVLDFTAWKPAGCKNMADVRKLVSH